MQLSLVRHLDKNGASLIEIMAMIAVLGLAVTAMFSTVIGGIYFARDSENRIKAINLAREWLEWVTNLRNTNWLRFSSDQTNCWKVQWYLAGCIGDSSAVPTTARLSTIAYVLTNTNGAWYLTGASTTASGLWVDSNGYYLASGATTPKCSISLTTNCQSPFTREIRITNASNSGIGSGSMTVTAVVDWYEKRAQNVTLKTTLTNWKSKF